MECSSGTEAEAVRDSKLVPGIVACLAFVDRRRNAANAAVGLGSLGTSGELSPEVLGVDRVVRLKVV